MKKYTSEELQFLKTYNQMVNSPVGNPDPELVFDFGKGKVAKVEPPTGTYKKKLAKIIENHAEDYAGIDLTSVLDSQEKLKTFLADALEKAETSTSERTSVVSDFDNYENVGITYSSIDSGNGDRTEEGVIFDEDGQTKLGDVILDIPPEQIQVRDINTAKMVPVARAGSVKLRSGKGDIQVEITINVQSIEVFNSKIRPLIAQIERSPWLPIQNYHVKNLFLPINPLEQVDLLKQAIASASRPAVPAGSVTNVPQNPLGITDSLSMFNENPNPSGEPFVGGAVKTITITPEQKGAPVKDAPPMGSVATAKDLAGVDLYIVIHGFSIQTIPGLVGAFYFILNASIFNHLPYTDKIRYLVDDEDVKKVIRATKKLRELNKSTDPEVRKTMLAQREEFEVNTTDNISKSIVFKKWYQGLLAELRTTEAIFLPGYPTKPYRTLPYASTDDRVLKLLEADKTQDILFRGWIDPAIGRDEVLDSIKEATDSFNEVAYPSPGIDNLGEAIDARWDAVKDNITNAIKAVTQYLPSVWEKALDPNRWSTQLRSGNLYIMSKGDTEWITIDEYLERGRQDAKNERSREAIEMISSVRHVLDSAAQYVPFDLPIPNDSTTTINGITASYTTNLVPITLIGQDYPTYQHFGKGEYSCMINLTTTNYDLVRKIRYLNMFLNKTRLKRMDQVAGQVAAQEIYGATDTRRVMREFYKKMDIEVMTKDGGRSNFLNAIGINSVLITDATYSTVKGQPGLWTVGLTIHQNDIDIVRQETVFSSNFLTEEIVDEVTEFLRTEEIDPNNPWWSVSNRLKEAESITKAVTTSAKNQKGEVSTLAPVVTGPRGELIAVGVAPNTIDLHLRSAASILSGSVDAFQATFESNSVIRGWLIRPEMVILLPSDVLVNKIKKLYTDVMPGFEVAYPDLNLPAFVEAFDGEDFNAIRNPSIYTAPDFYIAKGSIVNDTMLTATIQNQALIAKQIENYKALNAVNKDGFATRPISDVREALKLEVIESLYEKRQTLNASKATYEAMLDGTINDVDKDTIRARIEELDRELRLYGENGSVTAAVNSATDAQLQAFLYGFVSEDGQNVSNKILNEILLDLGGLRYTDKSMQMLKAYPTFKIYFVEKDSNRFLSFDDVYSYNSVSSIDVIWSSQSASKVAVIKMSNLTGGLLDPTGLKAQETFAFTRPAKPGDFQDTQEEQTMDGIYIRPGLRVIIKMGYSNDPYELETVFDGAVATMKPGEEVEIVCQSWAAELTNPIGTSDDGIHIQRSFWKDLGRNLIGDYELRVGFGDIARRAFAESGDLSQFSASSPFQRTVNFQPRTDNQQLYELLTKAAASFSGLSPERRAAIVDKVFRMFGNNTDDNIWMSWTNSVPWYGGTERKSNNIGFDWYIKDQTGFDVIQELLLWFPDHIFMELPYNEGNIKMQRSTLYVGPRNGLYVAEDLDPVLNPQVFNQWEGWADAKNYEAVTGHEVSTVTTEEGLIRIKTAPVTPVAGANVAWPVGLPIKGYRRISSQFGERRDPITGQKKTHWGVDFKADLGHPVVATIDGKIARHFDPDGYGNYITISNPMTTVKYAHLSSFAGVPDGAEVKVGEIVGKVGSTGKSTGPHLHYEVKIWGQARDPLQTYTQTVPTVPELLSDLGVITEEKLALLSPQPPRFQGSDNLEKMKQNERDAATIKKAEANKGGIDQSSRDSAFVNPDDYYGAPGFKRVNRAHFFDSFHHIVDNSIEATTENMWNKVVMYYPAFAPVKGEGEKIGKWRAFTREGRLTALLPFFERDARRFTVALDEEMNTAAVKVLQTFQKNIDENSSTLFGGFLFSETGAYKLDPTNPAKIPMYFRIANSILANGMKEMYSGSLTVLMDQSIRPGDRCYIFDYVNQMFGPIQVRTVHHRIDVATGATTTIVPELVVEQQNMPGILRDTWLQKLFGAALVTQVAPIAIGAGIGSTRSVFGAAVGAVAGLVAGVIFADKVWKGTGGYLMGRQGALDFAGLWYRGRPFAAGIEGMRRDTMNVVFGDRIFSLSQVFNYVGGGDR